MSYDQFKDLYVQLGISLNGADVKDKYKNYLKELSYAGGLAGVIDISGNGSMSTTVNVNKITVGESSSVSVVGDIAGFVAGHLSRGTFANRLEAVVSENSSVFGAYISAGLVGENYGRIRYSQVAATLSQQEEIDKAYAEYILNIRDKEYKQLSESVSTLAFVLKRLSSSDCLTCLFSVL